MKSTPAKNMDEYIAGFPKNVREMLQEMRVIISKAAPKAEETIKYAIPTFVYNGNLVSFAGYKNHVSLYPAPRQVPEFKKELSNYKGPKSTVQFSLDEPLPLTLISRIVKYLVKRSAEKTKEKPKK